MRSAHPSGQGPLVKLTTVREDLVPVEAASRVTQ